MNPQIHKVQHILNKSDYTETSLHQSQEEHLNSIQRKKSVSPTKEYQLD